MVCRAVGRGKGRSPNLPAIESCSRRRAGALNDTGNMDRLLRANVELRSQGDFVQYGHRLAYVLHTKKHYWGIARVEPAVSMFDVDVRFPKL
jgi:hypothetical protein